MCIVHRYDMDYDDEVVYCYEIQVHPCSILGVNLVAWYPSEAVYRISDQQKLKQILILKHLKHKEYF